MNRDDIAHRRMRNHHLWGTPLETAEEVLRWLAAAQAQEFGPAKWSIAQRAGGVSEAALAQAFADGAILRTHILRPTWHFVLPADLRWLLDLSAPRVHALNAYSYRRFGLDDELFARSNALLAEAVSGGRQLTRTELAAHLANAGITARGLQLGYILMRAELDAVLCSGALRGKQQTYASFDERVPPARALDREAALAELTRRYFTSRGPATLKDYLRWSSLTAPDGRRGLDLVKSQLERDVVDGRTYWFAASCPSAPGASPASPVIDLVQGYDEYIMSYSESKDVLQVPGKTVAAPQAQGAFTHALLLDGRVIGHWRPVRQERSVVIDTYLYRPLDRIGAQALDAAVERYGRFLGVPATLRQPQLHYVRP